MRASHTINTVFDDPNLVSAGGLVPVLRLAASAGLHELVTERGSVGSPNPVAKATIIVGHPPVLARNPKHQQIAIADKNYYGRRFETGLDQAGIDLLRPARKGEMPRPGQRLGLPRIWLTSDL